MDDYIRNSLLVLNTTYPGYSFEIEKFGGCVLLWCKHQVRNKNNEIDTILIKTRIANADLSHEKIVEEGKRLMNKINQEELRSVVGWSSKNLVVNKYSITPKEIIFQDEKTTIINWTDGTKTIVKCSDDDTFSPEAGVALCYMKKFITDNDSERFHRLLKGLIVDISKVRYSKQDDKSTRLVDLSNLGTVFKETFCKLYKMEEKHDNDINTGTPDNSGNNDSDGSAVEVES